MGQVMDEHAVEMIARRVLQPEIVLNLETKKAHSTAGCSFIESPLRWSTKCGWRWVGADAPIKFVNSAEGLPSAYTACDKCSPYMPAWFQ